MFKLPITHLMLSQCSDAAFLVTPLKAKNGLKTGLLYQMQAINTQGQVVLCLDGSQTQLEGPQGHWHDLTNLAWATHEGQPFTALGGDHANDNAPKDMENEGGRGHE